MAKILGLEVRRASNAADPAGASRVDMGERGVTGSPVFGGALAGFVFAFGPYRFHSPLWLGSPTVRSAPR